MPTRSAPRSSSATGTPRFIGAIAIIGGSIERFATEVRNLQHTEIGELQEPFRAGQKGSSAMPHKRNPILAERMAGLARLLRGYAGAALENQPLWHERDISHSSAERVLLPDATILLDYMLVKMTGLVERPRSSGPSGCARTSSAASACTPAAGSSWPSSRMPGCPARMPTRSSRRRPCERPTSAVPLRELLATEPTVAARLSLSRLDACFDDATFLRHAPVGIGRLDRLEAEIAVRSAARASA